MELRLLINSRILKVPKVISIKLVAFKRYEDYCENIFTRHRCPSFHQLCKQLKKIKRILKNQQVLRSYYLMRRMRFSHYSVCLGFFTSKASSVTHKANGKAELKPQFCPYLIGSPDRSRARSSPFPVSAGSGPACDPSSLT